MLVRLRKRVIDVVYRKDLQSDPVHKHIDPTNKPIPLTVSLLIGFQNPPIATAGEVPAGK